MERGKVRANRGRMRVQRNDGERQKSLKFRLCKSKLILCLVFWPKDVYEGLSGLVTFCRVTVTEC